jgi:hypothetical protein
MNPNLDICYFCSNPLYTRAEWVRDVCDSCYDLWKKQREEENEQRLRNPAERCQHRHQE